MSWVRLRRNCTWPPIPLTTLSSGRFTPIFCISSVTFIDGSSNDRHRDRLGGVGLASPSEPIGRKLRYYRFSEPSGRKLRYYRFSEKRKKTSIFRFSEPTGRKSRQYRFSEPTGRKLRYDRFSEPTGRKPRCSTIWLENISSKPRFASLPVYCMDSEIVVSEMSPLFCVLCFVLCLNLCYSLHSMVYYSATLTKKIKRVKSSFWDRF